MRNKQFKFPRYAIPYLQTECQKKARRAFLSILLNIINEFFLLASTGENSVCMIEIFPSQKLISMSRYKICYENFADFSFSILSRYFPEKVDVFVFLNVFKRLQFRKESVNLNCIP